MSKRTVFRLGVVLSVLALALVALGGCSKKPKVITDATPAVTEPVEPVKPAPTPEQPKPAAPDYANLDPSKYGIEDVFFSYDQYDLSDASMGTLTKNARILKEAGVTVMVAGHCDERGTIEYNIALGEKRAKAARDYLVSLGVGADKLKVTSYGESRPFSNGHGESDWAQNRRAHFERP